jgi:hypothetical protein
MASPATTKGVALYWHCVSLPGVQRTMRQMRLVKRSLS